MGSQSHRGNARGTDPAAQPEVRASGWARAACWTAFISALLPVAWRIAMLCGADLGFSQADFFRSNASAIAYVLGLEAIQALTGPPRTA